jgi:hypothetical protein
VLDTKQRDDRVLDPTHPLPLTCNQGKEWAGLCTQPHKSGCTTALFQAAKNEQKMKNRPCFDQSRLTLHAFEPGFRYQLVFACRAHHGNPETPQQLVSPSQRSKNTIGCHNGMLNVVFKITTLQTYNSPQKAESIPRQGIGSKLTDQANIYATPHIGRCLSLPSFSFFSMHSQR